MPRMVSKITTAFSALAALSLVCKPSAALEISGLLETEVQLAKDYNGYQQGDVVQTSVEIALEKKVSGNALAYILLLYEDDGDKPLDVDEAYIKLEKLLSPDFSITVGQQYLPFGHLKSHMISDPLVLELAETRESSVLLSYGDKLTMQFFVFNGDIDKAKTDFAIEGKANPENKLDNFGAALSYHYKSASTEMEFGISFINNIGDSDALGELLQQDPLEDPGIGAAPIGVRDYVPGYSSYFDIKTQSVSFIAEHIFTDRAFRSPEIRKNNAKPSALNVELGLQLANERELALAAQKSVDTDGLELPEVRVSLAYKQTFDNKLELGIEYGWNSSFATTAQPSQTARDLTIQFALPF